MRTYHLELIFYSAGEIVRRRRVNVTAQTLGFAMQIVRTQQEKWGDMGCPFEVWYNGEDNLSYGEEK